MNEYTYITLRERPQLKILAANWFHKKWGVAQKPILIALNLILMVKLSMGGIFV